MKIEKDSILGKIKINLPVNVGENMYVNNCKYTISNIGIFGEEGIYLINRPYGVWINLFDILDFEKVKDGIKIKTLKQKE